MAFTVQRQFLWEVFLLIRELKTEFGEQYNILCYHTILSNGQQAVLLIPETHKHLTFKRVFELFYLGCFNYIKYLYCESSAIYLLE